MVDNLEKHRLLAKTYEYLTKKTELERKAVYILLYL